MFLNTKNHQIQGSQRAQQKRWQIEYLVNPKQLLEIGFSDGSDVVQSLKRTPKSIPMHYRYDDRGSQLFEQICDVPEYYLTRTETAILQECASEIVLMTGACELVELGSGNAVKTRILLDAYQQLGSLMRYLPIDISAGILESSGLALLDDYPSLQIQGLVSTFEMGLLQLAPSSLPTRMICFIGSTLGGLNRQESDVLLTQVATALQPGEYFLLGLDLHKSKHLLEAAYNDSQGVNAQFNFNILHHLNQKFQGNFDATKFDHRVFYNESLQQMQIYLQSLQKQTIQLDSLELNIELELDELILTALARKFELNSIQQKLQSFGLRSLQIWTDPNQWYGLLLSQRQ
ncbi:L-histidine N(alpha)-methyltransferase [Nostoc sp. NMS4]|uniref:L-histidine N(alpha)-methyltransferase n=1 Tax=Nostoc sp. NMS4 TaxID=2815390 RepID=UPI0025F7D1EB|nr:L-histidine N(alpha)-methyltransferase [Nostoc sp. NMS4]MBN3922720.1 L-histidine N(alpha)-methyltransferase [Nostoc sp. NMS4]